MNPSQIKHFLLIAIGLYLAGLVLFLFGNGTRNNIYNNGDFLPMDNLQNVQNDRKLYRDIVGLKITRNDTDKHLKTNSKGIDNGTYKLQFNGRKKGPKTRKSKSHGKKRKLTNDSIEKLKRNRSRREKERVVNNKDYWESLKNLTFNEKVDVVFGHNINHNFTIKRSKRDIFNKKVTNKFVNKLENRTKHIENKSKRKFANEGRAKTNTSTLETYNTAFLEVSYNIFVFSSFFDDRSETHFVRNIIIARSGKIDEKLWCHYKDLFSEKWRTSILKFYETCENHLKTFAAYVGSCEIPENTEYNHIYISNTQETNIEEMHPIKVLQHATDTKPSGLAACVPPLFGNLNAVRLLEFIEFSIILGYKHFTFYSQNISSDILRILDHYQNQGLVTVIYWPLTLEEDDIWYHGQSAAVWDCLYRNMYVFKHVAFLDMDEYIFPRNTETITDFLRRESETIPDSSEVCAYRFQSAYFEPLENILTSDIFEISENIENYLVTINSLSRKDMFSNIRTKMIVDPIKIFELGIHHVSKPMQENFRVENVDPKDAVIHHYQKCKSNYGNRCFGNVYDAHALRFRNRLLTKFKWRFYYLLNDLFKLN